MKDIIIPAKTIRRESLIVSICVILAILINVGAIIAFKTQWKELFTALHYTLAVAGILYLVTVLPRLGWVGIKKMLGKN